MSPAPHPLHRKRRKDQVAIDSQTQSFRTCGNSHHTDEEPLTQEQPRSIRASKRTGQGMIYLNLSLLTVNRKILYELNSKIR